MQTIYLDISNKGVVPTVYVKQNDVGRKFAVILTDSGLPYIPEIGSVFSVWYKGASGEGNYTDIGDKSAFSLDGNKVEVEMIVQMLSAHGDGILCLTLNSTNGNQISSWNIPYLCEKVPGFESEGAKEYYTAFSESVKKLKQVTENLTPEAIGAAPAGWGYGGETMPVISGSDSALDEMLSSMKPDSAKQFCFSGGDTTFTGLGWFQGTIYKTDDSYATVVAFNYSNNATVRRAKFGGVWQPWEWVNPPLNAGKEYRTTERYKGKLVYIKCISYTTPGLIGGFEAGCVEVVIPHGCSNFGELVGCVGKIEAQPLPTISRTGGLATVHVVDNNNITIRLYNTGLSGTFTFELRYTKV